MGSAEREAEVFVPWLLQAHAQVSTEILTGWCSAAVAPGASPGAACPLLGRS